MTKNEFAKLTGKSMPQVRKLCDKGTFSVPGFGSFRAEKLGSSKTSPIDIQLVGNRVPDQEKTEPAAVVNSGRSRQLKEAKTAIEIQLMQQRLYDTREDIENKYRSQVVTELLSILEPLKSAFRKCKLTKEQKDIIDDAINESLMRCKQRLSL